MAQGIELPLAAREGEVSYEGDGSLVRRSILPGGIRVLTEEIPSFHSASVSMWVGAGSRDEGEGTYGSTHFLEHLLFKGTRSRTSQEISAQLDYLGGSFNAATSKQTTNYYGHVFEEDVPAAIELLADMVAQAKLAPADMEMERSVILEELAMYNDDASDVASEHLPPLVFGDHPFARPVGGTKDTVSALEHSSLVEHYQRNYVPSELVVAAAGAVNHDALCDLVVREFTAKGWELAEGADAAERRHVSDISYGSGGSERLERQVEQAAVLLGMPGIGYFDERRPALFALSAILGGGQSSRLFQTIREERGLAYSTYSFPATYREGGLFGLFGACSPSKADDVAELLGACLDELAGGGVSDEEVESAFRRVRADIIFDGERLGSRMNRLATSEIVRGAYVSPAELVGASREVTAADIVDLARELASGPRSLVIVGPGSES